MIKPHCSILRINKAMFRVSELGFLRYTNEKEKKKSVTSDEKLGRKRKRYTTSMMTWFLLVSGKGVESHLILYCIFIYIFSYILPYSFLNLL